MHSWVNAGQAVGRIAIAHGACEAERFAAEELTSYIAKISGVTLPIVEGLKHRDAPLIIILDASRPANRAYLGDLPIDQLRDDGYIIQSVGEDLVIASNKAFGIVFGVYQYLSRVLGCRFLDYAPDGEDIPHMQTIAHEPVTLLRNPRLAYRGMQMAYSPQRIDWMAKNGFNWIRMGNDKDLDWWDEKLKVITPHYRKRGIRINFGHHMFHMILPERLYLDDHPDFFNEVDGQPKPGGQFYWALRNRTALDEVIWRLERFLQSNPEIEKLDFWPSDGLGKLNPEDYQAVTCEPMPPEGDWVNSASGRVESGRLGDPRKAKVYALLAKHVGEALGKKFPQVEIIMAAYVDLSQPCQEVKLPDNVAATIAMYWRCYRHDAWDQECYLNKQYRQIITEWAELYPGRNLYLSEYYMGMGWHASLPYPVLTSMFAEWPTLIEMGVTGAKVNTGREVDTAVVPYNLNYLAFAAIAWNDASHAASFIEQYCRDYFGEAWQPMRDMYALWEQTVQHAQHTLPGIDRFHQMFNEAAAEQSHELIQAALKIADQPKVRFRIERVAHLVDYARRALPLSKVLRQRDELVLKEQSTEHVDAALLPQLIEMVEYFDDMIKRDQNLVGYVKPNALMQAGDVKSKPHMWAKMLATVRGDAWVKTAFDPNVLRVEPNR